MSPRGSASDAGDARAGRMARGGRLGAWILVLVFACLAAVTTLRHEMWRDEIHAWQAAVASDSPAELVRNIRPEGHPGLWFAMLYPVSRITANPVAMQVLHLMVAVAAAALLLLAAPFPLGWRALAAFGYFPLYEYGAISRNYAVGAMLLFLFCALYARRARRPLQLAAVLFLLAQASVYAMILSFALGLMWFVEERTEAGGLRRSGRTRAAAAAVWLAGITLSILQLTGARAALQPVDPEALVAGGRVLDVLATPWRGYVPLPRFQFHFWNTNILDGIADGGRLQVALGLALVVTFATLFAGRRPVQLLYLVGTSGLVAFSGLIYLGDLRHHGHHLLLLLACLWLWRTRSRGRAFDSRSRVGAAAVAAVLVASLVAGLYAVARDWRDPFSAGRAVAETIRALEPGGLPVVGHRDFQVATVAGYLQRPMHSPSLGRETLFIPWIAPGLPAVGVVGVFEYARDLARVGDQDVLVVLSRSGPRRPRAAARGADIIASFPTSIIRSERYELYRVPAPSAQNGHGSSGGGQATSD